MKKSLLTMFILSPILAMAQSATEPCITFTAETSDAVRALEFGSAVAEENVISIDWGDGNIVKAAKITGIYDGWTTTKVEGKVLNDGEVKIYSTKPICYFDCVSRVDGPGLTMLDVSKATELTELSANGNKLKNIDLSANTKLLKALLNNNGISDISVPESLTYLNLQNNKLSSFDITKTPNIVTLYLSENNIKSFDCSANTTLKSLYILKNNLESLVLGKKETAKMYVSANNNLLTSIDVSEATGLSTGTLFLTNNELTELKYAKLKTVNVSNNKFTIASLPTANITTLTYAPQKDMEIGDINGTIDLSAQTNVQGITTEPQPTTFTWCTESGATLEAGTDYTENDGVFTFLKTPAEKVYCTMATAAFPLFKGSNIFKTTLATVTVSTGIENMTVSGAEATEIYSVDGKRMQQATLSKGLYIMRTADGKTVKKVVR